MKRLKRANGYWEVLENCKSDALKYKTRTEWSKKSLLGYDSARRNGWLNEICNHMIILHLPNGYWTKNRCKEEALKFKSRMEWKNNSMSSYSSAVKNGWLNFCVKHMI